MLNARALPAGKGHSNIFPGAVRSGGFRQRDLARTSSLVVNAPTSETDGYGRGIVTVDRVARRSLRSHTTGIYVMDRYALFGTGTAYQTNNLPLTARYAF